MWIGLSQGTLLHFVQSFYVDDRLIFLSLGTETNVLFTELI